MSIVVKSNINKSNSGLEIGDVGICLKESKTTSEIIFLRINSKINLKFSEYTEIDPSQYGDAFDEKVCNVCHKIYPTEFFDKNQNGVNNRQIRRPSCRNCRTIIDGKSMSASERRSWMKKKPNLNIFECPICKKITIPGLTSKVVLNHDHNTGLVSGWICDSCNTGMGRFKDSVEILNEAIKYLRNHYPNAK